MSLHGGRGSTPPPQSLNALPEISVPFDPMALGSYMQSTALDSLENPSYQRLSVKSFVLYHISLNKTVFFFFNFTASFGN